MKYGVIVWHAGQRPVRHEFNEPLDALVAGVGYLRDGYLVTLSKPTCDALQSGNFSESIGSAARAARLAALFASSLRGGAVPAQARWLRGPKTPVPSGFQGGLSLEYSIHSNPGGCGRNPSSCSGIPPTSTSRGTRPTGRR